MDLKSDKKRVLILAKNQFNNTGYYHTDWLEAFASHFDCYFYEYEFSHFSAEHDIFNVLELASKDGEIDAIICATNWDEDSHHTEVNPCPNLNLSQIKDIPKIYFLNKEYKKLKERFEYCNRMGFTFAVTVNEKYKQWQSELNAKIIKLPFAVNPNRFKALEPHRFGISHLLAVSTKAILITDFLSRLKFFNRSISTKKPATLYWVIHA